MAVCERRYIIAKYETLVVICAQSALFDLQREDTARETKMVIKNARLVTKNSALVSMCLANAQMLLKIELMTSGMAKCA